MKSIITADNYMTIIAISFFLVMVLFTGVKFLKKKHIMMSIVLVCFMAVAAGTCISSIAMSIPYMEADLDAYTANYTDSLIGDSGIDSSMVELNFPQQ